MANLPRKWNKRACSGSIAVEYVAALVVFFLFITFPAIDLATIAYRYTLMSQITKECAHTAAISDSWTAAGSTNDALSNAQAVWQKWKTEDSYAIKNATMRLRINSTDITTKAVTHNAWNAKLAAVPPAGVICSVECNVAGDVNPLLYMVGSPINIPGVTSPMHFDLASQELSENLTGLSQ